jgi:hypothetical protein
MKGKDDLRIIQTYRITENVYHLTFMLQSASGDGIDGYEDDSVNTVATYNEELNRISFEELIQRQPLDLVYDDERFKMHLYLMEMNNFETVVYLALTNLMEDEINTENMPGIAARLITSDGTTSAKSVTIKYPHYDLYPNKTRYLKASIPGWLDTITEMKILER